MKDYPKAKNSIFFDQSKDVTKVLNLSEARRPKQEEKRTTINLPTRMIEMLDKEARRLGVGRQALIKLWIAERLGQSASNQLLRRDEHRPRNG
jgi:hypothetical protein